MADQDSATQKQRVRAGQKSSTTRIIAQVHEAIESPRKLVSLNSNAFFLPFMRSETSF